MFCSKCGNQIADGQKFCTKCGAPVPGTEAPAAEVTKTAEVAKSATPVTKTQGTNALKDFITKNKMMVILVAIAVLIIILLAMITFQKPTLKLDKYVTVEFSGYDSVGKATYAFDYTAFEKDYQGKIKINKSAIKKQLKEELGDVEIDGIYKAMVAEYESRPMAMLKQGISGSLDTSTGLSNGDTVKYVWSFDEEDISSIFNCKLKYKEELEFEVEGLKAIQMFDPFAGVIVEFSGMSPNANANINRDYNSEESGYLNYSLDKYNELKNGDTVTVTVELNTDEARFAEKFGKLPSPLTKTYTVEGLAAYIKDVSEVSEDLLKQMQSQAEDVINSYVAKTWNAEVSLEELTYLGNYFLTRKDTSYNDTRFYAVYRLTAKQEMATVDQGTIVENVDSYYYVCFHNPMIDTDGSGAVDISYYDTPSTSFTVETGYLKSTGWWNDYFDYTYRGYDSLDKLKNDVVTKNLEYYNHQDNASE